MADKQKVIDKLTPEQEARFPEFVEKWKAIGLSTAPVDETRARAAIREIYEQAEIAEPEHVVFTGTNPTKEHYSAIVWNNLDAGSLSFYNYMYEVLDLECVKPLVPFFELSEACGPVAFYDTHCFVFNRPDLIKFDDEGLLHAEGGPAISYYSTQEKPFNIYSWHGVRIPDEWVEKPETLTAQKALTWENIEQRRAACEIVGWVNILNELEAKVIDVDDDPQIGTLVEVDLPDIGKEKYLRVLCGTGREFALPVPPDMETALQANAWTYDVPEDFISQLEVRT